MYDIENCFTKSNVDIATASGWLHRLVRLFAKPHAREDGPDCTHNQTCSEQPNAGTTKTHACNNRNDVTKDPD